MKVCENVTSRQGLKPFDYLIPLHVKCKMPEIEVLFKGQKLFDTIDCDLLVRAPVASNKMNSPSSLVCPGLWCDLINGLHHTKNRQC